MNEMHAMIFSKLSFSLSLLFQSFNGKPSALGIHHRCMAECTLSSHTTLASVLTRVTAGHPSPSRDRPRLSAPFGIALRRFTYIYIHLHLNPLTQLTLKGDSFIISFFNLISFNQYHKYQFYLDLSHWF